MGIAAAMAGGRWLGAASAALLVKTAFARAGPVPRASIGPGSVPRVPGCGAPLHAAAAICLAARVGPAAFGSANVRPGPAVALVRADGAWPASRCIGGLSASPSRRLERLGWMGLLGLLRIKRGKAICALRGLPPLPAALRAAFLRVASGLFAAGLGRILPRRCVEKFGLAGASIASASCASATASGGSLWLSILVFFRLGCAGAFVADLAVVFCFLTWLLVARLSPRGVWIHFWLSPRIGGPLAGPGAFSHGGSL